MTPPLVVIDASVALALYLPDTPDNLRYAQATLEAEATSQIIAVVPDFWSAEVAYRMLKAARTRPSKLRVGLADAVKKLDQFPHYHISSPQSVSAITMLAERYHLQGWDALYFDIAVRHGSMLATLDGGLKTACACFGVTLWKPS